MASPPHTALPYPAHDAYSLRGVVLIFLVPALAGLLFGYDIGATSFALPNLVDAHLSHVPWSTTIRESPVWKGIVVSAVSLGALISSSFILLTSWGDRVGRKRELQVGGILYLVGGATQWSAGLSWRHGLSCLLLGRIIYGLGVGLAMHAAPTYLGEMAPAQLRGLLVSLKEAAIVTGILLGYTVGYAFSFQQEGWASIYATSIFISAGMLAISTLIPPSSRWLLDKGRHMEALEALRRVHPTNAELVLESIQTSPLNNSMATDDGITIGAAKKTLWTNKNRAPLLAGIGLVVLQQVTGQPSVLSYTASIFQSAGLAGYSSIVVASWKLVATLYSATVVEKVGRKFLLYAGCSLMLVALLVLSALFDNPTSTVGRLAVLFAMLAYIGGYQIGFGPITWLMTSEIFPQRVRTQAVAISVQTNFLLNATVQFVVPLLRDLFSLGGIFVIFAIMTGYSLYFVRTYVPETKGLSLEQIEQQFIAMQQQQQQQQDRGRVPEQQYLVTKV